MIKDYKAFWLNYFNVNKPTTRGAFWCAVISNILIQFYLAFFTCYAVSQSLLEDPLAVDKLTAGIIWDAEYKLIAGIIWGAEFTIFTVAIIIPTITLIVRRLYTINHQRDTNYAWKRQIIGTELVSIFAIINLFYIQKAGII